MEGCLKKLILDADLTVLGGPEKEGWETMGASGTKTVPGGLYWKQSGVYSQPLEGQKTNSGYMESNRQQGKIVVTVS